MASAEQESVLFKPLRIGSVQLSHRVALAPLTRRRAQDDHTHSVNLASECYTQRSCYPATLLISEGTLISPRAGVYNNIPGIYTHKHIEAWKQIVQKSTKLAESSSFS